MWAAACIPFGPLASVSSSLLPLRSIAAPESGSFRWLPARPVEQGLPVVSRPCTTPKPKVLREFHNVTRVSGDGDDNNSNNNDDIC